MTLDRSRVVRVLRRPGLPAAGDHARLMLRIDDSRRRPRPSLLDLRRLADAMEEARTWQRAFWTLAIYAAVAVACMLCETGGAL